MIMLDEGRVLRRETAIEHRGRKLVVTLHSRYLIIGEKGRSGGFQIDYALLYVALKLGLIKERKDYNP